MRPETYQLFAQLCETFLPEVSSSMNIIKGQSGGTEVVQHLHKNMNLSHEQDYRPISKISWSELKDNYRGAWVIIQGDKGVGAIRARGGNTGSYDAVASAGGPVETFTNDRGGNILDFLKGNIGGLRKFFVGTNDTSVADKKKQRQFRQAVPTGQEVNRESLIKKFKPLWARAITVAIADSKGHVQNQIKNDAFEKAMKKLEQISRLESGLEAIQSGSSEVPSFIGNAVQIAVYMAASHYYPDTTGTISKSRHSGYNAQFSEGPSQLLKDISGGDQQKLGTVLGFFKRSLISG